MCPQSHSLAAGELYLGLRSLPSTSQDLELQSCIACLLRRELGWRPLLESGSALKPWHASALRVQRLFCEETRLHPHLHTHPHPTTDEGASTT